MFFKSNTTARRAFRVSKSYRRILRNRKERIIRRRKPRAWPDQANPMFTGSNVHYEMGERAQAIGCGGIGAINLLSQKIGLVDPLNERVCVLKRRFPYHESDHIFNLAYNIIVGGVRLEDSSCADRTSLSLTVWERRGFRTRRRRGALHAGSSPRTFWI